MTHGFQHGNEIFISEKYKMTRNIVKEGLYPIHVLGRGKLGVHNIECANHGGFHFVLFERLVSFV
jgi:hypothetical protein